MSQQPTSFLQTDRQLNLWIEAQTAKTSSTTATFWSYIFVNQLFHGEQFIFNFFRSSHYESSTVEYFKLNNEIGCLLVLELAPHEASLTQVEDCEREVLRKGKAVCEERGYAFVYAMTCVGTRARCWRVVMGEEGLSPLFAWGPVEGVEGYIEINNEKEGKVLRNAIEFMKKRPNAGEIAAGTTVRSG